jgi:hypothetical protein
VRRPSCGHTVGAVIDAEGKRRRVKAARALGGFKSTKALAAKINQPKMSAGSLRTKEGSAGDEFTRPELREIAAACDLPLRVLRD